MTRKLPAALVIAVLASFGARPTVAACYDRFAWAANMPTGQHNSSGYVTILDDRTIRIEEFYYDGGAPAVYIYLGATNTHAGFVDGIPISGLLDRPYNGETLLLQLPEGQTLEGYRAVSVWCAFAQANFTSARFLAPPCAADADADRDIDLTDLAIVLSNFDTSPAGRCEGDFDADGDVDLTDLAILLANFGVDCDPLG